MNLRKYLTGGLLAHWKLIVIALLLAFAVVQTLRVTGLKSSLSACEAGRSADRSSYERAQAEAQSNALAAKQKQEAQYAKAAQSADADYDALRERYNSLLRTKAASGASGATAASTQDQGARLPQEVPAPAGSTEGGVCVNPDMLAGLSAYAIAAHRWAVSLEEAQ